jgi:predicted N-formylglutamate amidohydrolase
MNLLGPADPAPATVINAKGCSPFLLTGDHAGVAIPSVLGDLGVCSADWSRHIAIDIGVREMGLELARLLDAPFIFQNYSRLVIDCNRDPSRDDAIPASSDGTDIGGNRNLTESDRLARFTSIHIPYHTSISKMISARLAAGQETILLALHSFTPILDEIRRPWSVGILHAAGRIDFATCLLGALRRLPIEVGDNAPYAMDETDYSMPFHALSNDLRYAEIEIRQDLISEGKGQSFWAAQLCDAMIEALQRLV